MAAQFAMLVALAKLGHPQMVGQFAFGLAITAPLFLLANLRLRTVLATDVDQSRPFTDYLLVRLLTTGAALVASIGIAFVTGNLVVAALGFSKSVESISDLYYGAMQRRELMDR